MLRMMLAIALLAVPGIAFGQAEAKATPLAAKLAEVQSEFKQQLTKSQGNREATLAAQKQVLDDLHKLAEQGEAADPPEHRLLASIYIDLNQPQQALQHALKAIDEGPVDVELYLMQIACMRSLGDLAGAEKATAAAIVAFPTAIPLRFEKLRIETMHISQLLREVKLDEAQQRVKAARETLADYAKSFPAPGAGGPWQAVERNLDALEQQIASTREREALIGESAPPIGEADWVNGGPLTAQDLQGKVVLLDFWAMWCGPCIATFPHLRKWNEEFKDQGLVIVGATSYYQMDWDSATNHPVRVDGLTPEKERTALESFFKHYELNHMIAAKESQAAKAFSARYRVTGIPQAVVIDRAGKIRMIRVGSSSENPPALEKCLRECLAEEAPKPAPVESTEPRESTGQ